MTDNSETVIDHFIANITSPQIKPGELQIDIADHYPVFCIIVCDSLPSYQSKQNYCNRDYKKIDLAVYEKDISTAAAACAFDPISLNSQINLNNIFDKFITHFRMAIDKHAPLKNASRAKQKLLRKP